MTARQNQLLRFIADFIQENGFPPTFREMGDGMSMGSVNGVVCHLKRLRALGHLTYDARTPRGIRLLRPVPAVDCVEFAEGVLRVGVFQWVLSEEQRRQLKEALCGDPR